jgi:hypothetical protein
MDKTSSKTKRSLVEVIKERYDDSFNQNDEFQPSKKIRNPNDISIRINSLLTKKTGYLYYN